MYRFLQSSYQVSRLTKFGSCVQRQKIPNATSMIFFKYTSTFVRKLHPKYASPSRVHAREYPDRHGELSFHMHQKWLNKGNIGRLSQSPRPSHIITRLQSAPSAGFLCSSVWGWSEISCSTSSFLLPVHGIALWIPASFCQPCSPFLVQVSQECSHVTCTNRVHAGPRRNFSSSHFSISFDRLQQTSRDTSSPVTTTTVSSWYSICWSTLSNGKAKPSSSSS